MNDLKPIINIGKNCVTDSLVEEIKKQLKKRKTIKVKILKSAMEAKDRKSIADDVAARTGGDLVSLVGFTFVLRKK